MGIDIETLESCKGVNTAKEISQQARVWSEATSNLYDNKDYIKKFIEDVTSKKNCRIILTGAGTSAFAGRNLRTLFNEIIKQKSGSNSYNRLSCKS
ncbi:hypothetical protein Q5M85_22300 [Paraclostridium bifermentans]|nr:hypothetical protein [Paraclostridium bifermentans]